MESKLWKHMSLLVEFCRPPLTNLCASMVLSWEWLNELDKACMIFHYAHRHWVNVHEKNQHINQRINRTKATSTYVEGIWNIECLKYMFVFSALHWSALDLLNLDMKVRDHCCWSLWPVCCLRKGGAGPEPARNTVTKHQRHTRADSKHFAFIVTCSWYLSGCSECMLVNQDGWWGDHTCETKSGAANIVHLHNLKELQRNRKQ